MWIPTKLIEEQISKWKEIDGNEDIEWRVLAISKINKTSELIGKIT